MDCGLCGHERGHECGHGHGHGNKLATCNSQRLTRLPGGGGGALLIGCLATDGGGASNVRSFCVCSVLLLLPLLCLSSPNGCLPHSRQDVAT